MWVVTFENHSTGYQEILVNQTQGAFFLDWRYHLG